ncbi:bacterio-opsin activator HTH domain-containing protein [Halovivax asiaticus JCM 14624]|uniref:Bacterio-opsin activator HTH domain-containing protein n=1 Tax=Halovivax asiaticus JCM 14624 TaxID=1227490 RepID=M0BQG7_9EURY|nr:helix-turn-helix domain-containing protein [Halovivax asiaticus]ELZ12593.1 bacterio-opsin activator HTH domain-containing protein [Halovivax asiaticus JCM 14624]
MIGLSLSVRQCDCPLSAASGAHDVAFVTPHWHYDHGTGRLEMRVLAEGASRTDVERGLSVVRDHEAVLSFDLLAKEGPAARARVTMGTTDVMGTLRENDGYLTGPFENAGGSERWTIGFDDERAAESTLAELDEQPDEYEIRERTRLDPATALENLRAESVGTTVLSGARRLTSTERETIHRAVDAGYYDVPRGVTLGDLAVEFDISDAAVSKTLRRAERKLLAPTVAELASVADRGRPAGPESEW